MAPGHTRPFTREDFTRGEKRYNLIFAANGYHSILDYKRALRPGGRYVMAGGSSPQIFQALLLGPLVFMTGDKKMAIASARPNRGSSALRSALPRSGARACRDNNSAQVPERKSGIIEVRRNFFLQERPSHE